MFKGIGIIFPAASTVTVEILDSLNNHKGIHLIGVNSHINYENKILFTTTYNNCPLIENEMECIQYLLDIAVDNCCNFIIPTMDYTHLILSKHESIFMGHNIKIISSSYDTNKICISKEETYNKLYNVIDIPSRYNINNISSLIFPLFIKPKVGYGSRNCCIVNNTDELTEKYNDSYLILEYLPNDEFTIDCFTYKSKLLYINIRKRILYKNGLSVITQTINDDKMYAIIMNFANKINDTLDFTGAWFFQVKYDKNNICKLLEVSTRIAGASSINRLHSCNLILLTLYYHFNYPVEIIYNNINFKVNKIFNNYVEISNFNKYNNIYIDLDDTLLIDSKINIKAISMIYNFLNLNKNIYLISRHKYDIIETLNKYKIDKHIFKDIIHVKDDRKKSDYVKEYSIFIDDSFRERNDVKNVNNVLVFDNDFFNFILI